MKVFLTGFGRSLFGSARDLLPIVLGIAFFQLLILQQPIPNPGGLVGFALVAFGVQADAVAKASDKETKYWKDDLLN